MNDLEMLRRLQENLSYVLQWCDEDGIWRTDSGLIAGRTSAYDKLNARKRARPGERWRVIPKNEADKYVEGLKAANRARDQARGRRRRLPLLALPEPL